MERSGTLSYGEQEGGTAMVQVTPIPEGLKLSVPVVQAEVASWTTDLAEVATRIGPRFDRAESRTRALASLQGLLSPIARKNGWQLAEQAGERHPDNFQHLLNRATWSPDAVRDDLRAYVVQHLGDSPASLIVDETGFLKKGTKSAGVGRQYSGTAGKIENCQIGVLLAYTSARGRTWLDRELYLPEAWTTDRPRCREAGIPDDVGFQTKPQLAQVMLARALEAGVPAKWVTGDEVYGHDRKLRLWLESRPQGYVLAVPANEPVWQGFAQHRVKALVDRLAAGAWPRLSAGDGAKGPRWYDWALVPLNPPLRPGWQRWLLARRSLEEPREVAYYVVFAPVKTPLQEMVRAAGSRWSIEECIEAAKGEVGLDQYEVRLWTAWYRHITLALFAHAYLTVIRAEAHLEALEKRGPPRRPAPFPQKVWRPRPRRSYR
jgi:SRSO17 transposase